MPVGEFGTDFGVMTGDGFDSIDGPAALIAFTVNV